LGTVIFEILFKLKNFWSYSILCQNIVWSSSFEMQTVKLLLLLWKPRSLF